MPISNDDKFYLYEHGFTHDEIRNLDSATDPKGNPQVVDIHSSAWESAIARRYRLAEQARIAYQQSRGKPLIRQQYDSIVNMHFKGDIFAWLKLEYKPQKKTDFLTAAQARQARKESNLKRHFTR